MATSPTVNITTPMELYELLRGGCVILTPQDFRTLRVGIKNGVVDPELRQELLDIRVTAIKVQSPPAWER